MVSAMTSYSSLTSRRIFVSRQHSTESDFEFHQQGRNMVYPGPIDPYFLAFILIPEPHFPQNFDPWALITELIPSMFLHKILT